MTLLDEISKETLAHTDITTLPESLVTSLKSENYFTLLLPASLGGKQMDYPDFIRLVENIAKADGSTAWCVGQGSVLSILARLLPPEIAREIWQSPATTLANGPPEKCESRPAAGGYSLTGTWTFSSGISHAEWLLGMAPVTEGEDGAKTVLWHFFPKSSASIRNEWPVNGLKATGSFEFSVENLHIPSEYAVKVEIRQGDDDLYQIPMNLLFACGFAAIALGISRAALDFTIEKLQSKIKRFDRKTMNDSTLTQDAIGRAEAIWQATEAYLHTTVGSVWESINELHHCTFENKVKLRLAGTHSIRQSKEVTDIAYDLCSTASIFTHQQIQKQFQDMHIITQHLQGRPEIYSLVGKHYLGLPANSHLIN